MNKRIPLLLLVILALFSFSGIASATPVDELTSLSRYYPDNTAAFAVMRTDAGYVETLDGLLGAVANRLPEGTMEDLGNLTVADLLDFASSFATGQPYRGGLDQVIGSTVAIGVFDFDALLEAGLNNNMSEVTQTPFMIAAEIQDREAVLQALTRNATNFVVTEGADYDLFSQTGAYGLVAEDVILLSSLDIVEAAYNAENPSLEANETFNKALLAFPAEGYNILAYVNMQEIIAPVIEMMQEDMAMQDVDMTGLFTGTMSPENIGAFAMGFTVLEGRTLALDVVSVQTEEALSLMMETPGYVEQNAVSADFAQYVPASTQFLIHDNGFGTDFLAIFDMLDAFGPMFQQQLELIAEQSGEDIPLDLSAIQFGGLLQLPLTAGFAGLTGLNLEDDVLSWMTGDYATHISVIPVGSDLGVSVNFGMVTEATDVEAAATVVQQIAESAGAYELTNSMETIGEGEALVLPNAISGFLPTDLREPAEETPELDVLVGSDSNVFVVGARPAVEAALNPSDSLAENETFQYAAENALLNDPVSVYYISIPAILDIFPSLQQLGVSGRDLQDVADVLGVLESATVTTRMTESGTITRLTLTVEDAPYEPLDIELEPEFAPTLVPTPTPNP